MGNKIIGFTEWCREKEERKKKENTTGHLIGLDDVFFEDTTKLLEKIKKLKEAVLGQTVTLDKFREHIEKKISTSLLEKKIISPAHFFCAMYIARLLTEVVYSEPEMWCAIDHLEKARETDDTFGYKKGGDMCFLVAAVFPGRGNWRLMDITYYKKMGAMFYSEFYYMKRQEIGYHMSCHFDTMAKVTNSCVSNL